MKRRAYKFKETTLAQRGLKEVRQSLRGARELLIQLQQMQGKLAQTIEVLERLDVFVEIEQQRLVKTATKVIEPLTRRPLKKAA